MGYWARGLADNYELGIWSNRSKNLLLHIPLRTFWIGAGDDLLYLPLHAGDLDDLLSGCWSWFDGEAFRQDRRDLTEVRIDHGYQHMELAVTSFLAT